MFKNFSTLAQSLLVLLALLFLLGVSISFSFELSLSLLDKMLWSFSSDLSLVSFLFGLCVVLISVLVFTWSRFYMGGYNSSLFYVTFLIFVTSMLLLIFSNSLLMVFIGWEGLGVSSFILIIFYQNWSSTKGGLLTLLTNRLGDGLLMLTLVVSLLNGYVLFSSFLVLLILIFLAFTKSAQWPFLSWLPAAMAAPTPVSALVHSSTLVTAGIWLMLRFSLDSVVSSLVWLLFGIMTLSSASLAALFEADAKKLVALSTLSQLGLMVVSLSVSTKFICLLHVLSHAFAKANLFMVVGNVMHFHYSSQESRAISFSGVKFFVFSSFVSIVSLSGLLFSAGFYSKEAILSFSHSLVSSLLLLVFLLGIICLTFLYSYKLLSVLLVSFSKVMSSVSSVLSSIPSVFMVTLVLLVGYYFCKNLGSVVGVSLLSSTMLLWGGFLLSFMVNSILVLWMFFSMFFVSLMILRLVSIWGFFSLGLLITETAVESFYLVMTQSNVLMKVIKGSSLLLVFVVVLLFL